MPAAADSPTPPLKSKVIFSKDRVRRHFADISRLKQAPDTLRAVRRFNP